MLKVDREKLEIYRTKKLGWKKEVKEGTYMYENMYMNIDVCLLYECVLMHIHMNREKLAFN
jgi:hypothetical protein